MCEIAWEIGFAEGIVLAPIVLSNGGTNYLGVTDNGASHTDQGVTGRGISSEISLRATPVPGGAAFAVIAEGERRPAIVGRWRTVAAGTSLLEDDVRAGVSPGRDDAATLTTPRDGAAVGSGSACDGRRTSS